MNRRNWIRNAPALGFGLGAAYAPAAAPRFKLKITRVEAFGLRIPFNDRVRDNMHENYRRENIDRPDYRPWIVRIHTDEGLAGLGESAHDPRSYLSALKGRSAYEFLNNGALTPGLMIAVYDLVAQAGGVPISKLFSPKPRPTVQATWWSHCLRPPLLASEARRGVELGYEVHKIKTRRYEDPVEQMAAVAAVVPHDYQIYLDANGSFGSAGKTLTVMDSLRRFEQVKGIEQPIAHEDLVGYRQIRRGLPFRLAVHYEAVDVRSFLLESLCDAFVVEDWKWGPALNEKSELCRLTGQNLWVENGLYSGISQVFQAHQCSALPNVEFTISLTHIGEDDIVEEPFTVEKGGFYRIPTKPGLGVTLDQKALDKYRVV
ncbi:MAG: mandelate racemase/muconate lactonizing enzyme family protein [Bryobacterales bacterium]|nr:mandelate racemase/muconate lactonizing enzyme family protein [Bryobacterales bacterium]